VEPAAMTAQLSVWAQWGQLIATGGIAVFAAFIAYRQWRTAHQRVVLDLFERRMAIYDAARAVIGEIVREGAAEEGVFFRYVQATDRLPLLFGDEVVKYSNETRERINQLTLHTTMVRANSQGQAVPNFVHHVNEKGRILGEIVKFYDEFSALVMPYVRMTQSVGWQPSTKLGLTRLIVVCAIPWVIGWGLIVYSDMAEERAFRLGAQMYSQSVPQEIAKYGHVTNLTLENARDTLHWLQVAREKKSLHVEISVGVPLAILLVSVAGFWVWRGFVKGRPR